MSQQVTGAAPPRVLAVASAGGHWVQLRRLEPAFAGCRVCYVTTDPGYRDEVGAGALFRVVSDGNRWNKLKLIKMLLGLAAVVLLFRPKVVVTTGAAPGYFAIRLGKLVGARGMWIDSIANADELSLSGRLAMPHADAVLTQWSHLANGDRPAHHGAVL